MSTARFTSALADTSGAAPGGEVDITPAAAVQSSTATLAAGQLFTQRPRHRSRRVLVWVADLTGEQIGVVT